MCLSPIPIKNPNYGLSHVGLNYLKDCDSQYIGVPCGHCAECIRNKQMSYIQRCQMEFKDSYCYMLTLTYNNESLPIVTTSTGYNIRYADIADVQNMFKRFRNDCTLFHPFRYIGVSELGSTRGRPHFHFILAFKKSDIGDFNSAVSFEHFLFTTILKNWVRNYGSKRVPLYKPLCTYRECWRNGVLHRNYDLHLIVKYDGVADDACSWYILKYMLKPSDRSTRLQRALRLNLPIDEYEKVWSKVRCKIVKSIGFGLNSSVSGSNNGGKRIISHDKDIISYLKSCIRVTSDDSPFPFYFSPIDGKNFPLSNYYKRCGDVYSVVDAHSFYFLGDKHYFDKSLSQVKSKIKSHEKNSKLADCSFFDDVSF